MVGRKTLFGTPIINQLRPKISDYVHYVEPYFGSGAVLFDYSDYENVSEVVNDLNGQLTNFWQVLQSPSLFSEFRRIINMMPVSQVEWKLSHLLVGNSAIDCAVKFFINCRQSLTGRMQEFTALTKSRTRRGMNAEVSAWLSSIDNLDIVHDRLIRVVILNDNAIKVIKREDSPTILFYLDPPYYHPTRTTVEDYGEYEMSHDDHLELLRTLATIKGKFILSGYNNQLYENYSVHYGWNRLDFPIDNKSGMSETKQNRIESIWRNYT